MMRRSGLVVLSLLLIALYNFRGLWLPPQYESAIADNVHSIAAPVRNTWHRPASAKTYASALFDPSAQCAQLPGSQNVLVLVKTGAISLYKTLPTHFVTTLKCVPNFMIFSDLAQTFAEHPVHDAIAAIDPELLDSHDDFDLYRRMQDFRRTGQDLIGLQGYSSWSLDKWKFLPMLHHAFDAAGDEIDWYVVIEDDTSLSWTNLLQLLARRDPREPIYAGAPSLISDVSFAAGGSGIVISRRAADMLARKRRSTGPSIYDRRWEATTGLSCCGDAIVARAFADAGVPLTPVWPLLQGEKTSSLDWTAKHWCAPAVSWSKATPLEIDALWQLETRWITDHGNATPFLYRDVFAAFIAPHIALPRLRWDNLSRDRRFISPSVVQGGERLNNDFDSLLDYEQAAVESADVCAEACRRAGDDACVQWMFKPGRCYLGREIRFGQTDPDDDPGWTSGWLQERVASMQQRFDGCEANWEHG